MTSSNSKPPKPARSVASTPRPYKAQNFRLMSKNDIKIYSPNSISIRKRIISN